MIILWSLQENYINVVQADCVILLRHCDQLRQVCLFGLKKALKYQGLCNTLTKRKKSNHHNLWYKVRSYNVGNEYYVFACCQEKEVMNNNDGSLWQEPPSTYSTNIWLEQHHAKRECKLPKVSYLVYFDWYEEVEMMAHNILCTVALISDCNKFLSASVNQLYWYVITLFALCVSIDLPQLLRQFQSSTVMKTFDNMQIWQKMTY